jgi:hypothetical protein
VSATETPFLIGIDLGTTNSAVAFVDTRAREPRVELFLVPQLTEPGRVEPRPVLPSFLYFPEPAEIDSGARALPWSPSPDTIVGVLARERGAVTPGRQIASAKSWLAHPGIDRRAAILPWGETSGPRLSPVDASARYLRHMREAWNATVAREDDTLRLERQRIVLTVPASFDEEARELTVDAARQAGLERLRLLEEPIAAFYAWTAEHRGSTILADHQLALVCDVGGGTTDFSLIRVRMPHGAPTFERVAIGEHLLLGGDNVDLALAAFVERRMAESRPDVRLVITQRAALRRSCAAAKERILGDEGCERVTITVLGAGRSVVGGSMAIDLTRDDVQRTIDEFIPVSAPGEVAAPRDRRAGLRELGLPYETDPAITRHLAAFLARSASALAEEQTTLAVGGLRMVRPDLVLFNGGFFTPAIARARVLEALARWLEAPPQVLTTRALDAAVALGAATYACIRAGLGPSLALVKAGSGRAYYVRIRAPEPGAATPAVCVLARGTDEGTTARLEHPFTIVTNRPISFALYSSTVRSDRVGDLVSLLPGDDAREHAPLVTVLRYGRKSRHAELPVRLSVAFTEVGTLELWCESQVSEHRWRLQFQTRNTDALAGDPAEADQAVEGESVVAEEAIAAGEQAIRSVFADAAGDVTPVNVLSVLEQSTGYAKSAWPLAVIRRLADVLIDATDGRRRSESHEARWLNLFGFCLRPGFGAAKDPWRIGEARKVYAAGLSFPRAIQNRAEWLVLWQRVAGGFSAGQQRELAQKVMGDLGLTGKRAAGLNPQLERESWRLLASLERLDAGLRAKMGEALLARLRRDPGNTSFLWAIGRLGARVPLYGPLSSVVAPPDAGRWLDALVSLRRVTPDLVTAIVQIAAKTGDALRDVDGTTRERSRRHVLDAGIDAGALRALDDVVETSDANRAFGEPLPDGLRLDLHADVPGR